MDLIVCSRALAIRGVILTVFLSLWSQQISAQVSVVPIPKTVMVGENVLLSVSGVTGTILLFSWHKGERSTDKNQMLNYSPNTTPPEQIEEPYKGRVRVFPNCSMEILGVNTNDNGSYTVSIQTRGGQQQQQQATVTIIVYEKVSKPNVTSNLACPVEYKDSITLTCVTTNTTQIILWSKDSQKLPSDDRTSLSQENRTLTITNVSSADSGNYQCEVMNSVSHSTSDLYTLTVCSSGTDNGSGSLPGWAIAVIVIAILIVVALIAACVYYFLLRDKSKSNDISMKESTLNSRSDPHLRSSSKNPATQTGEEVNYSEVTFKPGALKPTQPKLKENTTEYAEISRT
ncbi:carcinoembryonic antigen-related cell adhesion molecule 1 isoform X4 [Microcaecilia unicolor]|uniref:Carcinoembryonic antigen-related cell adhesion molecule 1-like isoform X4 n=1 Tax=Microcaecilia unicolor TaxID=1415580 RepID=A0A6P7YUY2_9AMPH|nr:carcinoembryonic antigen-related cell adhesion molecule 1-like isoform X4 [Microcaecilia unicolor]